MKKKRCECPNDSIDNPNSPSLYSADEQSGVYHKPNKCPCTAGLSLWKRGHRKLWLCSCCSLIGDIKIKG